MTGSMFHHGSHGVSRQTASFLKLALWEPHNLAVDSGPPPSAKWRLVWCFERCHKAENEKLKNNMMSTASAHAGTLVCMKKAHQFATWSSRPRRPPFILVTDWREAQPCFSTLSHPNALHQPVVMIVLCGSERQVRRAEEWVAGLSNQQASMVQIALRGAVPGHILQGLAAKLLYEKSPPPLATPSCGATAAPIWTSTPPTTGTPQSGPELYLPGDEVPDDDFDLISPVKHLFQQHKHQQLEHQQQHQQQYMQVQQLKLLQQRMQVLQAQQQEQQQQELHELQKPQQPPPPPSAQLLSGWKDFQQYGGAQGPLTSSLPCPPGFEDMFLPPGKPAFYGVADPFWTWRRDMVEVGDDDEALMMQILPPEAVEVPLPGTRLMSF